MKDVIRHYDKLIDENNDPVRDPEPLRGYMDKWDGDRFIECMKLDKGKSILEIGIGTGRLAIKTAPLCRELYGIDISPRTVERALENLAEHQNVKLICGDFMSYEFDESFDVIYSSLTFMHIEDKLSAVRKTAALLNEGGIFLLSLDKNQSEFIDMGTRKIKIYPDDPAAMTAIIADAGLKLADRFETEQAYVMICEKPSPA